MEYANTSLCFVTAHLAAGFSNYDERNRDYKTISHGLRFQRNRSIDDHDSVIWLGDFNYRIGLSNERTRQLIEAGDFESLYNNDQLNIQMVQGHAFRFYSEARITFAPTYKFDNGSDQYDTSEKARIPAWTDRVLRKGENLRQINYNAAPLRFSDHRPVYATFNCEISVIDEKYKENLSAEIYRQRKGSLGTDLVAPEFDDTDEELLSDFKSVELGLPPASSDRRKWWLDNSLPARSTVRAPGPDFVPNPQRPSNPFTPSEEADWVKVERAAVVPPPPRRSNTNNARPVQARGILPPPTSNTPAEFDGADLPPRLPIRSRKPVEMIPPPQRRRELLPERPSSTRSLPILPPPSKDLIGTAQRVPDFVNIPPPQSGIDRRSSLSPDSRKGPPPRPKKPSSLSSAAISPTDTNISSNSLRSASPPVASPSDRPAVPPPRRSVASSTDSTSPGQVARVPPPKPPVRKPIGVSQQSTGRSEGPGLPPRRTTESRPNSLMDEGDEMDGLKDWEVLRPV